MEEQEDYGFIYITENLINGKQYIGQRKFYRGHRDYLGSGIALKRAIELYGTNNFSQDIIEICGPKDELNKQEEYWINYYDAVNSDCFYNLAYGGNAFRSGISPSEETKKKMSNAAKGRIISESQKEKLREARKRYVCSDATAKKISESNMGRVVTEETRRKISEGHKGKIVKEETRQKLREVKTGTHHSDETKKKISDIVKGHTVTQETRERMRNAQLGKHCSEATKDKRRVPVLQFDLDDNLIKSWNSAKTASDELGLGRTNIITCCRHRRKTHGGFKWEYASQ